MRSFTAHFFAILSITSLTVSMPVAEKTLASSPDGEVKSANGPAPPKFGDLYPRNNFFGAFVKAEPNRKNTNDVNGEK
ncbi:hypothetical protein GALMADRAFT_133830 [Galerina marginata CBS 339.88]|uniref:Uncharacterized protein n=1 Tax=Galerina marginata (strain CBS 339.88) TaxID=685588 RepID=A0A067TMX1_GALM3|nr:hypothetical protein GALMADRAFT_133830 [Galerina marginata CBS 339.88]